MSDQNQQKKAKFERRRRRRQVGEVIVAKAVFRRGNPNFPHSMVMDFAFEGEEYTWPAYPVDAFRPREGEMYAIRLRIIEIPDKFVENRNRYIGYAAPVPGLNVLTPEELLPPSNLPVKTSFVEDDNKRLMARDPNTGAFIVPAHNWAEVTKAEIQPGKDYDFVVQVRQDGLRIAHPVVNAASLANESTALALAEKTGVAEEFHRQCVLNHHKTRWVHFLDVLGLPKAGFRTVTAEEVKKAFHKKAAENHPDKKANLDAEIRDLATARMGVLKDARDKALEFIKRRNENPKEELMVAEAKAVPSVAKTEPARKTPGKQRKPREVMISVKPAAAASTETPPAGSAPAKPEEAKPAAKPGERKSFEERYGGKAGKVVPNGSEKGTIADQLKARAMNDPQLAAIMPKEK